MDAIRFSGPEQKKQYLAWLDANPTLFVLNSYHRVSSSYLMLHSASCRYVAMQNPTRRYSKTCGTRDAIKTFLLGELGPGATWDQCAHCLA